MDAKRQDVKGLYAFWAYDLFPFILGGPVEKMGKHGEVETKNFGPGFWFTPLKIMPEESGKELHEKINLLEKEYDKDIKQLREKYYDKLNSIAPFSPLNKKK